MRTRSLAAIAVAALLALTGCGAAGTTSGGQEPEPDYPQGTTTLVSYVNPGGGIELALNSISQTLSEAEIVTERMQVTSIPGGSGLTAIATLVNDHTGADDTIMIGTASPMAASLQDPGALGIDQLVPIVGVFAENIYVYVRADSPYQTIEDLADALEADPKSVALGGGSLGSADTVVVAQFARELGLMFDELTYLPLTGEELPTSVLGGHIAASFSGPEDLRFVESGDMRVLAVSSPERLEFERAQDIPTFVEQGYPGVTQVNWRGLFGPPEMPDYAVQFWSDALVQMTETDQWNELIEQNLWQTLALDTGSFEQFLEEQEESLQGSLTDLGLL